MGVMIDETLYLAPTEAAWKASVSSDVIRAALRAGKLTGTKIIDRWVVHPDDLVAWIAARKESSSDERP
jgi:hypothetical protein